MVAILMSPKLASLGLLQTEVFWKTCYDVIISAHDVTNKILSRDLNFVVVVAMWSKFGSSNISTREVVITWIL